MEKLSLVTDVQLHERTLTAAANEKRATLFLLDHLAEIDTRRLYAVMGYSSLWEYVNKALKYSESQTSERVNAMRLMVRVPEVKKEIEAGRLSLTTTAKLAAHVRREKCIPAQTLDLLTAVAGKSSREVERVLCAVSTEVGRADRVQAISSSVTRIVIDVNQSFLDLMKRTQELGGHPGSSSQDLFRIALQEFVKRREVKQPVLKQLEVKQRNDKTSLRAKVVNVTPKSNALSKPASRHIPHELKTQIRVRSNDQCEYFDSSTKHRCTSKMNLQYEHVTPFAAQGSHTLENLRHFCATHNRLTAIQFYGVKKMQAYFKR